MTIFFHNMHGTVGPRRDSAAAASAFGSPWGSTMNTTPCRLLLPLVCGILMLCGMVRADNPPVADAGGNKAGDESNAVAGTWTFTFSAAASTDDGTISSYEWDWNYNGTTFVASGDTGVSVVKTFFVANIPGRTIAVRVKDNANQTSVATAQVTLSRGAAPTAEAGANITAEKGSIVVFDGGASTDDAAIGRYAWSFGDGKTWSGKTPWHIYNAAGTYTVSLTAYDRTEQASAADTLTVTVLANSTAPLANAGGPYTAGAGGPPAYFDGRNSSDDGDLNVVQGIVKYLWDVNTAADSAGDADTTPDNDIDLVGPTPFYTYATAGTYTVKLTVIDGAGQSSSATTTVTVTANEAPNVICVPYRGNALAAHPAISGVNLKVKAVVRDAGALTYQWNFGDGSALSPATPGTVSNKYAIEASHAYTGPDGKPFTAELTVWDSAGLSSKDQFYIVLKPDTPANRAEIAIENGLWYLHNNQNKSTWKWNNPYDTSSNPSAAASAIQAFEINGTRLDGNPREDPYVETIQNGFNYLFTLLGTKAISGAGDTNGNLLGIEALGSNHMVYQTGMVMDAIASSQKPLWYNNSGGTNIKGRFFIDLLTDMVDVYAWGQNDSSSPRGGWQYGWNTGASDNSASQWGAIGMLAAEDIMGVNTPAFVKSENLLWLTYSYDGTNFGYATPTGYAEGTYTKWHNTSPSGLIQMVMDDKMKFETNWMKTEAAIAAAWPLAAGYKNYYGDYAITKAFRLALPEPVVNLRPSGVDWYGNTTTGLRQKHISQQLADGSWSGTLYDRTGNLGTSLSTAWVVIMLSPTLFVPPPVAVINAPTLWGFNIDLPINAANSYHVDPAKHIVRYQWDMNNDGTYDIDTTNPRDPAVTLLVTDPHPNVDGDVVNVTIKLKVTDNNDPAQTDETSLTVRFSEGPYTPFARLTGPPSLTAGIPGTFDGSASFDNDPGDIITKYEWDFNNDGTPDVTSMLGDANPPFSAHAAHAFPEAGQHYAALRVTDNGVANGGVKKVSDWEFLTVAVAVNIAPVARPGGPYTVNEDTPLLLDGSASSDANNDPISYAWDFNGDQVTDATGAKPTWTFTQPSRNPADGAITPFNVKLTVTDGAPYQEEPPFATTQVTVNDITPPADITNFACVPSYSEQEQHVLTFSWTVAADTDGDLANYLVYDLSTRGAPTPVGKAETTYPIPDLTAATVRTLKITSIDTTGNESTGVTLSGYTLMPNPETLVATGRDGKVDLQWAQVQPVANIQHFAIYMSQQPLTDLTAMTPFRTAAATLTANSVAGLTNGQTYYFAITTVNKSGGESKALFTTASAVPSPDTEGPIITSIRFANADVNDGFTCTVPGVFTVVATDPSTVSRVEFWIDGALATNDTTPGDGFSAAWNIVAVADGAHTLQVRTYDAFSNRTDRTVSVAVALAAPTQAPTITSPADAALLNTVQQTVQGTAPLQTSVQLYLNGAPVGGRGLLPVGSDGTFSGAVTLVEGQNTLKAAAVNRGGTGPESATVTVTLDTSIPKAPENLTAESRVDGYVYLTWRKPDTSSIKGYNLYRANAPFTDKQSATKVNTTFLTGTTYTDLPIADGAWHYRVCMVSHADTEGTLSEPATGTSDRTPPRLAAVLYTPHGSHSGNPGTVAPGLVDVTLTFNEPLMATPFFSLTPAGGLPISVALTKQGDTEYAGAFEVKDNTPSGTATAVVSARDVAGNRGTAIDAGGTLELDTDGPVLAGLVVNPAQPIDNSQATIVNATLTFDEPIKAGTTPTLSYTLSVSTPQPAAITTLNKSANDLVWLATFTLPAGAGTTTEYLAIQYQGQDALSNSGNRITAVNQFEVYKGTLPALNGPAQLIADSLPAGNILLTWTEVAGAGDYEIYRQTASGRPDGWTTVARSNSALTYTDHPGVDGTYRYAVGTVRKVGQQESISELKISADVLADSVAPPAPTELALQLLGTGVRLTWEASASQEPVTYSVYRAGGAEITSVTGLTPIRTGIAALTFTDTNPSATDHAYTVTAVDDAGNQSGPATSAYLNVTLLPVSTFTVTRDENTAPLLAWTHAGSAGIAGFNVYLDPPAGPPGLKLNTGLVAGNNFADTGFSGDERRYRVVAVDNQGVESIGRTLTLPAVQFALQPGESLRRNVMNALAYDVTNNSSGILPPARMLARVIGLDHPSATVSLGAGATQTVSCVVGGYTALQDTETLVSTLELTPNPGETVAIIQRSTIAVSTARLPVDILNGELVRGVGGNVMFTLANTSDVEVEIITAKGSGASDRVRFKLFDKDNNLLASQPLQQSAGNRIVSLANGEAVARIPAGETFTCVATPIFVPANAPLDLVLQVEIDAFYYQRGQTGAGEVTLNGALSRKAITLQDTAYYGEITSVTPAASVGTENITITGRALTRTGNAPLPFAKLKLGLTLNGFDRVFEVLTDAAGSFSQLFTPQAGESGVYQVWLVHPDRKDKSFLASFVIHSVYLNPSTYQLRVPFNYQHEIPISATTGSGSTVTNLRFVVNAADQTGGVIPDGLHLAPGAAIAVLGPGQRGTLKLNFWADNAAGSTGSFVLRAVSDSVTRETINWGTVRVNYELFVPAQTGGQTTQPTVNFLPNMRVTPGMVVTGVQLEHSVTEQVTIASTGLAPLKGVQVSLLDAVGTAPAPAWVSLAAAATLGDIAVGATKAVGITFAPPAGTAEGNYTFFLRLTSSNYPAIDIGLYPAVTQAGSGNVLFKVSDMYTGTLNAQGQVIQGLAGAAITIENETVSTERRTATADSLGEVLLTALPAGSYKFRVSADRHDSVTGRLWIRPGATVSQDVAMKYNLITVEWQVVPITIEDRYEIVLSATYETNVPAAVVTMEPASVPLPAMAAGDVFNGEFRLTNHGFIRADNLAMAFPVNDANFTFELVSPLQTSLAAKEQLTVPYRITCVEALEDSATRSAPCRTVVRCCTTTYTYECENGTTYNDSVRSCATYTYGDCRGGIGSGGPGGGSTGGSGGWGGFSFGAGSGSAGGPGTGGGGIFVPPRFAPPESTISGTRCWPVAENTECTEGEGASALGATADLVGCSVNKLSRDFNDGTTDADPIYDLTVAAFGFPLHVDRSWQDNAWHWTHLPPRLQFRPPPATIAAVAMQTGREETTAPDIGIIVKDGIEYGRSGTADVYLSGTFRFVKTETGWRWEDKNGNYELYDAGGRLTGFGIPATLVATFSYDANDRMTTVSDKTARLLLTYEYDADGRPVRVSDCAGNTCQYTWTGGRLTKAIDVLGNETRYEYDGSGHMTAKVDPEGRRTSIAYGADGYVTSVTDALGNGHFFTFDYDSATRRYYARTRDTAGMVDECWFDSEGELVRHDINGRTISQVLKDGRSRIVVDEKGNRTTFVYDEHDNLVQYTLADGAITTFEYDAATSSLLKTTDFRGYVKRFEYNASRLLTRMVEAEGTAVERVTTYSYDANGQLLTETAVDPDDAKSATSTYTYDELGELATLTNPEGETVQILARHHTGSPTSIRDALGQTWSYTYDKLGRLTGIAGPGTWTHSIGYDRSGNVTQVTDARGAVTAFAYDGNSQLSTVTDPLGKLFRVERRSDSLPVKFIDEMNREGGSQFESEGRLTGITDGGNTVSYVYDTSATSHVLSDRPVRINYPTFYRRYEYDVRQRVTRISDCNPANDSVIRSVAFEYDAAGNTAVFRDQHGSAFAGEYDALDRLVRLTDPLGRTTEFGYDRRDNLASQRDANNGVRLMEYDRADRLVREVSPENRATTFSYGIADNNGIPCYRIVKTAPGGNTETWLCDAIGRPLTILYAPPAPRRGTPVTLAFTYTTGDRPASISDGTVTIALEYDLAGRLTREATNYGAFTLANLYAYHDNGLLKTFTGADGIVYTYSYDTNNRLAMIDIPGQGAITCNDYTWNSLASLTFPGGIRRLVSYDAGMRTSGITVEDSGQDAFLTRQYTLGPSGNILQKQTEHGTYNYQYDEHQQVTAADNPAGMADEAYTYDGLGNRLTSAAAPGAWTYDKDNRLRAAPGVTLAYDANGNVTERTIGDQTLLFTYDVRGWLTEVHDNANNVMATYGYDPAGRRIWKEVGGVRRHYHYSAFGLDAELDANGTVVRTYGYAPNSQWGTAPLFVRDGATTYWCHTDHLGTPQMLTSGNGQVAWAARYDSFGNTTVTVGQVELNLRFPGQYFDVETGLHHNLFRYYDPQLGRYLQPDPAAEGFNYYTYGGGNPLQYFDPFGTHALANVDWAGFIPVYGSLRDAYRGFQEGGWRGYARGIFNLGMAALDCTGVGMVVSRGWRAARTAYVAGRNLARSLAGAAGRQGSRAVGRNTVCRQGLGSASRAGGQAVRWPPHRGFDHAHRATLRPGAQIDRYGGYYNQSKGRFVDSGEFVAPRNTPYDMRALPYDPHVTNYASYEVVKPIPVMSGPATPWFGQVGGGTQHMLPASIDELVNKGYLRRTSLQLR